MPCALLGRIRFPSEGLPAAEYLHRAETLFAEPEWSWTADRALAFTFPNCETAVAESVQQRWQDAQGLWHLPWPIVCATVDVPRRTRREYDRVATVLASVEETTDAGCRMPEREVAQRPERTKKVIPMRASGRDGQNGQNGPLPDGPERWKKIYRERVAPRHVSPQESFEQLERRHLA